MERNGTMTPWEINQKVRYIVVKSKYEFVPGKSQYHNATIEIWEYSKNSPLKCQVLQTITVAYKLKLTDLVMLQKKTSSLQNYENDIQLVGKDKWLAEFCSL